MDTDSTSYEEELREYHLLSSRACGATVIVLIVLGVVLDYFVYPADMTRFALARLLTSLLIGAALIVLYTEIGRRYVEAITFAWLMLPQLMIAWMIYETQGESSLFYAGTILTIFAVGTLFPVGYLHTLVFGLLTILYYFLACFLRAGGIQDVRQFLFHATIIFFASLGASVFTYFNERVRRQLIQLKGEVMQKNSELAKINANLVEIKGQMIQQEKMAAIGTLSAGLLHEVNNPVNYCLMAMDVAIEDPVSKASESLTECLQDAKQGMQRVQHIVSDLKTFAYRKGDTEGRDFLFERAVSSAIRLVGHQTKGISVTAETPKDTLVTGDEAAIIGVLVNLLSNAALALHSSNRPNPSIHVAAKWQNDRLFISVTDNGPGIPPENLGRVFEPFFTTREIGQGLGLGLSISYSVIERHGGTLLAESAHGEWTKMIFDLPRAS